MKINFDAAKPIYEQIIDQIKKMVARGDLKPGDKLPSQRELARKVQVNPNTIQRAYREMEVLDLIETKRGMGTFIKDNNNLVSNIKDEMAQNAVIRFIKEMNSLGFTVKEISACVEKELNKLEGGDIYE